MGLRWANGRSRASAAARGSTTPKSILPRVVSDDRARHGGAVPTEEDKGAVNVQGFGGCALIIALMIPILPTTAVASSTKDVDAAILAIHKEAQGIHQESLEFAYSASKSAVETLTTAGVTAIPRIDQALRDSSMDWATKALLCMALSNIHDQRSIKIFKRIIFDKTQNELVRSIAGHELVTNQYTDVSGEVEKIVEDESLPVAVRAEVMGDLSITSFQDVAWLRRVALGGTISKSTDVSLNEGAGIMWNAMRALGASKNPAATGILIDLQSKNPANAILTEAIRKRRDAKTIPVLVAVLTSTEAKGSLSPEVAAKALGELKAEAAVEPLQQLISSSSNPLLIAKLAEALGNIGDRKAIPTLQRLVENIDKDPRFGQYHEQEKAGYGPIPPIKNALRKLSAEDVK